MNHAKTAAMKLANPLHDHASYSDDVWDPSMSEADRRAAVYDQIREYAQMTPEAPGSWGKYLGAGALGGGLLGGALGGVTAGANKGLSGALTGGALGALAGAGIGGLTRGIAGSQYDTEKSLVHRAAKQLAVPPEQFDARIRRMHAQHYNDLRRERDELDRGHEIRDWHDIYNDTYGFHTPLMRRF